MQILILWQFAKTGHDLHNKIYMIPTKNIDHLIKRMKWRWVHMNTWEVSVDRA